jgi:hypothetical protein
MERTPEARQPSATDALLTRKQVADRLGISVSAVRRMEGKTLHPVRDDRGRLRFAPTELPRGPVTKRAPRRTASASPGEQAARVFEAFRAGHSLRHIVTRLRVEPRKVRELYAEWQLDLMGGERRREEEVQRRADAREQREQFAWMRALDPRG